MELETCPNCLSVFSAIQGECAHCGADGSGRGAEVEFDVTARSTIQALGGIYGGILAGPVGSRELHVLWCARGVCAFDEVAGLLWKLDTGPVEDVSVRRDRVALRVRGRSLDLNLADGAELVAE